MDQRQKRSLTPKRAIKILQKNGVDVSEEQAGGILGIMYFLADIIVKNDLKNENFEADISLVEGSTKQVKNGPKGNF